jgi:multidrug efflux pump subunit AcrB
VDISVGYVGLVPTSYPINSVFEWMSGPEEAILRVAFKRGSGIRVEAMKERLRDELATRVRSWLRQKMLGEGMPPAQVDERVAGLRFSFEPSDIVNQVMSFGSPTPVEVAVSGPKLNENRAYAETIRKALGQIDSLQDLQFAQPLDYPAVEVKMDRELAGRSGVTAEDVARSLVAATSSSRFVVPNYWRAPDTGIGYQVQVEIPQARMNSPQEVGLVAVKNAMRGQVFLRDIARIEPGTMPGEYDRYNMRRLVSVTANLQGEDLGRVARRIGDALAALPAPSRGVQVDVRGQVPPMQQLFAGLRTGLLLAVAVIFLLLTAYFQSLRLALVVLATVPAVAAGALLALLLTGTTINLQSFMGAIMAVGVAVANAILFVTFAERARRGGADPLTAAADGAEHRLRPILMTSCAMIAGMLPLALGLGEGGEHTAPLGRAVIGGLLAATLTTLLVLPSVFALIQGRSRVRSVSLDPDDPESAYFDPAMDKNAQLRESVQPI